MIKLKGINLEGLSYKTIKALEALEEILNREGELSRFDLWGHYRVYKSSDARSGSLSSQSLSQVIKVGINRGILVERVNPEDNPNNPYREEGRKLPVRYYSLTVKE